MSVSQGKVVRDGRRLGFFAITQAATARLAECFDGRSLAVARSIYMGVVECANRERCDTFTAFRAELAAACGVSPRTLTEYADRLEESGLIVVERRMQDGVNLPNVWTLTDPPERGAAAAPVAQQPLDPRAGAARGVEREPPTMQDHHEEGEESPPVVPPGGQVSLLPTTAGPTADASAAGLVALWAQVTPGREKAKPTAKRLQAIRARLRSFSAAEVERAIREAALSDFHNGQNDRNTVYNDLTTTMRDDGKLEAWLLKADRRAAGIAPTEGLRNGSSRSAAVDANMAVLDSYSSPNPADRWE